MKTKMTTTGASKVIQEYFDQRTLRLKAIRLSKVNSRRKQREVPLEVDTYFSKQLFSQDGDN